MSVYFAANGLPTIYHGTPAVTPPFDPLTALAWSHSGWAEDPTWTPPADGAAVTSWRNAATPASPVTQTTPANQPTFRAVGINGRPSVRFDGADALGVDPANFAQPYSLVAIFQRTETVNLQRLPITGRATSGAFYAGRLSGAYGGNAGGTTIEGGSSNNTLAHLGAFVAAGAGSKINVDGTTVVTGDAGSSGFTDITVGAANTVGANGFIGDIALWGFYPGDITADAGWPAFKVWVTAFYGIATV